MKTKNCVSTFSLCVIIAVIFHFASGAAAAVPWIEVANFQEDLIMLRNKGLGVQEWQDYLDLLDYQSDTAKGATFVNKISGSIGRKFNRLVSYIKLLKKAVEDDYGNFTTSTSFKRCCDLTNLTYDQRFFTGVDVNATCELISRSSSPSKKYATEAVVEAMKENQKDDPSLKWQYFGTEDGVSTVYPANKYSKPCGTYDPRVRPWYVESATPIRKDVILVIDKSYSMRLAADPSKGQKPSLMDIAKEAAATVLDTLAPHDMVGVVTFSTDASTLPGCYSDGLAHASGYNIETLKKFVGGLSPSGGTSYLKALTKAFSLFSSVNATDGRNAEKVILFLTDGEPKEKPIDILKAVKEQQKLLNNSVTILTYGLGEDIALSTSAKGILTVLVNVTFPKKVGSFTQVIDPSTLRNKMAFFYKAFQANTQNTLFSIPYFDAFGLGMVTTVTIPAFHSGQMIGVIGIDLPLKDLFSDSDFNRHYVFVIDLTGRAWIHPLLTKITSGDQVSTNINIAALERNKEAVGVIESMKRGENGNKSFVSDHLQSLGDPFKDGVVPQNLMSTYYWKRVDGLDFSVCLVMVSGDVEGIVDENSGKLNKSVPFHYHRSDILPPVKPCRHFQRVSESASVLKFSPESFKDPIKYLDTKETSATVDAMKKYLTFVPNNDNPGFLDDIRATVAMTNKADRIWQTNRKTQTSDFIAWRYIGTNNGIMRMAPSAMLAKAYNPMYRSWYTRAVSQPGKSVFSTPYLDVSGAGDVVTMSQTLYIGNRSNFHTTNDTVMAVLGIDFTLGYFYQRIHDTFPKCKETGFQCFIIDTGGYLIIHQDFVAAKTVGLPELEYMHITIKEPNLARQLITGGYMKEQGCINMVRMRDQVSWKVDLGGKRFVELKNSEPKYEVSYVDASNIFVVVKLSTSASNSTPCSCIPKSTESVGKYECKAVGTCQCPCHNTTTYQECDDKLKLDSNSYMTCPPGSPSLIIPPFTLQEKQKALTLAYCYQKKCPGNNYTTCMGLMGCSWCQRDKTGSLLPTPYCASQDVCYLGVVCMPDPYKPDAMPTPMCKKPVVTTTAPTSATTSAPSTTTTVDRHVTKPPEQLILIIVGAAVGGVLLIIIVTVTVVLVIRNRQGKPPCPAAHSGNYQQSTLGRSPLRPAESYASGMNSPSPDIITHDNAVYSNCFDPPTVGKTEGKAYAAGNIKGWEIEDGNTF